LALPVLKLEAIEDGGDEMMGSEAGGGSSRLLTDLDGVMVTVEVALIVDSGGAIELIPLVREDCEGWTEMYCFTGGRKCVAPMVSVVVVSNKSTGGNGR